MKYRINELATMALFSLATALAAAADEKTEVEKKTEELAQQTALLEAQTKLYQAKFPVIAGGKEGTLTKGEGGLYPLGAWEQVYLRLGQGAEDICAQLTASKAPGKTTKFALVTDADLEQASRFRLVRQEQDAILKEFERVKAIAPPPKPVQGLAAPAFVQAIPAVVGSLVSIAKLFRTDIELHDETVTIATATLQELVYGCLRKVDAFDVQYPAITGLYAVSGGAQTQFLKDIDTIVKERATLPPAIDDDKANPKKAEAAKALLTRVDKFIGDLYATPTGGARAPITDALLGEAVVAAVQAPVHLLIVAIVQQGGNSMITKSFWRSDRLFVGGGVIVSYKLIGQGQLLSSATIRKVDPEFRRIPLQ